jgi:hypothetical protein
VVGNSSSIRDDEFQMVTRVRRWSHGAAQRSEVTNSSATNFNLAAGRTVGSRAYPSARQTYCLQAERLAGC